MSPLPLSSCKTEDWKSQNHGQKVLCSSLGLWQEARPSPAHRLSRQRARFVFDTRGKTVFSETFFAIAREGGTGHSCSVLGILGELQIAQPWGKKKETEIPRVGSLV